MGDEEEEEEKKKFKQGQQGMETELKYGIVWNYDLYYGSMEFKGFVWLIAYLQSYGFDRIAS